MDNNTEEIEKLVIQKLKTINDLELPVSIYELGLIYKTSIENIDDEIHVNLEMTTINSSYSDQKSITYLINSSITSINEVDKCNIKAFDSFQTLD
jgi:metal-sulfur cluster biosynthetic enzyme